MKKLVIIIIIFAAACSLKAYEPVLNPGVDTTNKAIKDVYELWRTFLVHNPDSLFNNPCWNKYEKAKFDDFNLSGEGYFTPNMYAFSPNLFNANAKPVIMSIMPEGDDLHKIKTAFVTERGEIPEIYCILETYVKNRRGKLELWNALSIHTKEWDEKEIGSVTYNYCKNWRFDYGKAKDMQRFIDSLTTVFAFQPLEIEYFMAEDWETMQKARGFEYFLGMGNYPHPAGYADVSNKMVYTGGMGEYYPHEVARLYLEHNFPNSNCMFIFGMATVLGGCRGETFQWHLDKVAKYIENHPNEQIFNTQAKGDQDVVLNIRYIDDMTNPGYVIGGVFCKMALEQGGIEKLKKLLSYGTGCEDFYTGVKAEFGIPREELNNYMRNEIEKRTSK